MATATPRKYTKSLHPHDRKGKFAETIDAPSWLSSVSQSLIERATGGKATDRQHADTVRAAQRARGQASTAKASQNARVKAATRDRMQHESATTARALGRGVAGKVDQQAFAQQLRGLDDDKLYGLFADISRKPKLDDRDEAALSSLSDEMGRREKRSHRAIPAAQRKRDGQIDVLVSKGVSFRDAYAEVEGVDPAVLDRQERASVLDAQRGKGETREQTMRRLYQEQVHLQYLAAEQATNGHMLNAMGKAQRDLSAVSLFSGTAVRANAYASPELRDYWRAHPRVTFAEFKAATLARPSDKAAAVKAKATARDAELAQPGDKGQPRKRAPRKTAAEQAAVDAAKAAGVKPAVAESPATLAAKIQGAASEEEAKALMQGLTGDQLKAIAPHVGVEQTSGRKADLIDRIAYFGVGARTDSAILRSRGGVPLKSTAPAKKAAATSQTDTGGRISREEAARIMYGDAGAAAKLAPKKTAAKKAAPAKVTKKAAPPPPPSDPDPQIGAQAKREGVSVHELTRARDIMRQKSPVPFRPIVTQQDEFVAPWAIDGRNPDFAALKKLYDEHPSLYNRLAQERQIDQTWQDQARRAYPGMTLEEARAQATDSLQKAVAGAPVIVRRNRESTLRDILKSGRMKTQHETGESSALLDTKARGRLEDAAFGPAGSSDVSHRPVYGVVSPRGVRPDDPAQAVSGYGDIQVVLKPSVRSRTTVTVGDSLAPERGATRPAPIDAPDWRAAGSSGVKDLGDPRFESKNYVEAQIHGGVKVADIEEVVFARQPEPETVAALDGAGVSWRVLTKGGATTAAKKATPAVAPAKATRAGAGKPAKETPDQVAAKLATVKSRQEAHAILAGRSAAELKRIAKASNIAVRSNAPPVELEGNIVQWTIGRKLDSIAISRPAAPANSAEQDRVRNLRPLVEATVPGRNAGSSRDTARAAYQQIADRRPYAGAAADLAELQAKGADNKTIAEHLRLWASPAHPDMQEADRGGNGPQIRADLEAVAQHYDRGDQAGGVKAMDAVMRAQGLSASGGGAGATVKFDPAVHRPVGDAPAAGSKVRVIRPGVAFARGNGDVVPLSEAQVVAAPTAAKVLPVKSTPRVDLGAMSLPELRAADVNGDPDVESALAGRTVPELRRIAYDANLNISPAAKSAGAIARYLAETARGHDKRNSGQAEARLRHVANATPRTKAPVKRAPAKKSAPATEAAAWEATPRVLGDAFRPLATRSGVDGWPASDRRAAFEALQGYKVNGYRDVNDRLRGREPRDMSAGEADLAVAAIDDAFKHSQLPQDVVVWRGLGTGHDVFGDTVDADLTGVEWTDEAYMSTSALHDSAEHYARPRTRGGAPGVLVRMVVPSGVGAIGAEAVGDYRADPAASEAEVLLQRGLKLRVVRDHGLVPATDESYLGPRTVRLLDVEVVPAKAAVKRAATKKTATSAKASKTSALAALDAIAADISSDPRAHEPAMGAESPLDTVVRLRGRVESGDLPPEKLGELLDRMTIRFSRQDGDPIGAAFSRHSLELKNGVPAPAKRAPSKRAAVPGPPKVAAAKATAPSVLYNPDSPGWGALAGAWDTPPPVTRSAPTAPSVPAPISPAEAERRRKILAAPLAQPRTMRPEDGAGVFSADPETARRAAAALDAKMPAKKSAAAKVARAKAPSPTFTGPSYQNPPDASPATLNELHDLLGRMLRRKTNPGQWDPYVDNDRLYELKDQVPPATWRRMAQDADIDENFALFRAANPSDLSDEEFKADLARRAKAVFAGRPVAVRVTPTALGRILGDGKIRTQFETLSSSGLNDAERRAAYEAQTFGLDETTTAPASRPVYGYVMIDGERPAGSPDDDQLSQYGQVQIVLKDRVRSRTTAMIGDSMDFMHAGRPSPIDNPNWQAYNVATGGIAGRPMRNIDRDYSSRQFRANGFAEAEIHGGVSVDDIAEVLLPSAPTAQQRAQLDRSGVPWRVLGSAPQGQEPAKKAATPATPQPRPARPVEVGLAGDVQRPFQSEPTRPRSTGPQATQTALIDVSAGRQLPGQQSFLDELGTLDRPAAPAPGGAPVRNQTVPTPNGRITPPAHRVNGDEPLYLPNGGNDQGLIHLDSEIGQLWQNLVVDNREPNSFVNEIARMGDDMGRQQLGLQQVLDRLQQMRGESTDSAVADRIQATVDKLSAPPAGDLHLPADMPQVLRDAFAQLAEIPTARKRAADGELIRIGNNRLGQESVLDKKLKVIQDLISGNDPELLRMGAATDQLMNRDYHESSDAAPTMWSIMAKATNDPEVKQWLTQKMREARTKASGPKGDGGQGSPSQDFASRSATVRERSQQTPSQERGLGGGSSYTRLLEYPDGSKLVHKDQRRSGEGEAKNLSDSEELGAHILDAVGARAPAVHRSSPAEIYMEWMPGKMGSEAGDYYFSPGPEFVDSPDGRLMGLADALMGNADRNTGNWIQSPDGRLVGIDHGFAFGFSPQAGAGPALANPFARHFATAPATESGMGTWAASNDMSPADMAVIRPRLEALRPRFERLGRGAWFTAMMDRMDILQAAAHGTESRLA